MSMWERIKRVFKEPATVTHVEEESTINVKRVDTKLDKTEANIVVVSSVLEDGKIALEVDWTDQFIVELGNHGYTGTPEERVHRYLATLHQQMMTEHLNDPTRFD